MSLSARGPAACGAGDLMLAGPRLLQRLSCGTQWGGGGGRGEGSLKYGNETRPAWGTRERKERELGLFGQKERRERLAWRRED